MKQIFGLLIIAAIVLAVGANVRGTIAVPATSATSIAATSALGTAVVIQQLTMCVLPLGVLVVIGLAIVAWMACRKERAQAERPAREVNAPKQLAQSASEQINSPARTTRMRRRKPNHAARAAARMFGHDSA